MIKQKEERRRVEMPIREASEPHVALSLLLDASISMDGSPIKLLNSAVNQMIEDMKQDDRLRNIVDLAIFTFGEQGKQNIYQGFRSITDCEPISIQADDESTFISSALEQAVSFTKKRVSLYNQAGGAYKPWVVVITDGEFFDDDNKLYEIGSAIKELEQKGRLNFFALGVDGYDRKQLEMLTSHPARIIEAKSTNFVEFLSWIGKSMAAISQKSPIDKVELPPLKFEV